MNITNASNVTNTVSEQGLYCWLNLQSEMDLSHLMPPESLNSTSSRSKKEVGFLCPLTLEPLRVGNLNITEAKSYLSSSATSHHVFLM